MPRKPGAIGVPADAFVRGRFPDGKLRSGAPVGAAEMAEFAIGLRERLEALDLSISALAASSEVDRTTIHDLLAGRAYCDVVTLAKLEHAVGDRLWPGPQLT